MKYIRMHTVEAEPKTFGAYAKFRFNVATEGKDMNAEGYEIKYPDGYVSWCPKAQFEEVSRPCEGMTFGMALEAMRRGKKVARGSWIDNGVYIWLMPGSVVKGCKTIADKHLADIDKTEGEIRFLDSIRMRTANGCVITGWTFSQTDVLADDWRVVE